MTTQNKRRKLTKAEQKKKQAKNLVAATAAREFGENLYKADEEREVLIAKITVATGLSRDEAIDGLEELANASPEALDSAVAQILKENS